MTMTMESDRDECIAVPNAVDLDSVAEVSDALLAARDAGSLALIAFSASGNSPNILACVGVATAMNVTTIGFTGFDGGKLSVLVEHLIHVPTRKGAYGPVEDVHLAVNHMITERLKESGTSQGSVS